MDIGGVRTLDDLALALRELRARAGSPSYAEIARRIGDLRAARGRAGGHRPSRATVYDCFRSGRRRVNPDLVAEIVAALGGSAPAARRWRLACAHAQESLRSGTTAEVRSLLPFADAPFVGRADELARIAEVAASGTGPRVVVVEGMPGVGKSRLVVEAARRLLTAGRLDRVLLAELHGHDPAAATDPATVLDGLLRAAGVPEDGASSPQERRSALESALAGTRTALLLDDVGSAADVTTVMPSEADVLVLVTSRRHLELPAVHVGLTPFAETEAVALLGALAGAAVVAAEPEAARALVECVGHLPLAVEVLARRAAATAGWRLEDHLAVLRERLAGRRVDEAVEAVLGSSYAGLGLAERRMLRLLAAQPCPGLDVSAVAALVGLDERTAGAGLEMLADQHLVVRADGRHRMHALVRAFAADRSTAEDRPADRRAAVDRLAEHFVTHVWAAYREVNGDVRTPRQAVPAAGAAAGEGHTWLTDNVAGVLALAGHLADAHDSDAHGPGGPDGGHRPVNDIAEGLTWWLLRQGRPGDALRLSTRALDAARARGDEIGVVRAWVDLGQATLVSGDPAGARVLLDKAARAAERAGAPAEGLAAVNTRAIILARSGDLQGAAEGFREVAEKAERLGNRHAEAKALDNLAILRRKAGDLAGACALHARTAALAGELGDADQEARALVNRSEVLLLLERPEEALAAALRGVELAEPLGTATVGYGLDNAASALLRLGRADEALTTYDAALACAREAADAHLEAAVLNNLATAHLRAGALDRARGRHEEALDICRAGDPFERARALAGLGEIAWAEGDGPRAVALWTEAHDVFVGLAAPEAATLGARLAEAGQSTRR